MSARLEEGCVAGVTPYWDVNLRSSSLRLRFLETLLGANTGPAYDADQVARLVLLRREE